MAADSAGNDLNSVHVVTNSLIRLAPYSTGTQLTAALIAPTVADPATGLNKVFTTGSGFVGLITKDGAPQDGRDADDATEFHQPGYMLNADPKLTLEFTAAEDNDLTRAMTIGTADTTGVYHVVDTIQDSKWIAYQETVFKNGKHRRRLGVVQITGAEPDQEKRGDVAGIAFTAEWIKDPITDGGNSRYLESYVTPTVSSGSHDVAHQADDSESQPVAD